MSYISYSLVVHLFPPYPSSHKHLKLLPPLVRAQTPCLHLPGVHLLGGTGSMHVYPV